MPDLPTITHQTLTRANLAPLLTGEHGALRFEQCAFDGEDLSRLDLRGVAFIDCTFAETSFERSIVAETT